MAAFLMLQVAMDAGVTMVFKSMMGKLTGDDDDDNTFSRNLFSSLYSNIPFVNKLVGSMLYRGGTQVVVAELITDSLDELRYAITSKKSETKQKHAFKLAANVLMASTGLPPKFISDTLIKIMYSKK